MNFEKLFDQEFVFIRDELHVYYVLHIVKECNMSEY